MSGSSFVEFVLRSPLHSLLGATMLLTVTGRKTRRKISIPVNYYRDGEYPLDDFLFCGRAVGKPEALRDDPGLWSRRTRRPQNAGHRDGRTDGDRHSAGLSIDLDPYLPAYFAAGGWTLYLVTMFWFVTTYRLF